MKLHGEQGTLRTELDDTTWAESITKLFDTKWKCNVHDQMMRLQAAKEVYNEYDFKVDRAKLADIADRIKKRDRCDDDRVCPAAWLGLDEEHLAAILEDWINNEATNRASYHNNADDEEPPCTKARAYAGGKATTEPQPQEVRLIAPQNSLSTILDA